MEKDIRIPARLVDGHNMADEISHSWLAPFNEASPNLLCIYLNRPIVLAAVRVWNYAKTPSRGAKEFHLYLDDTLLFDGVLQKYEESLGEDFHQSTLVASTDKTNGPLNVANSGNVPHTAANCDEASSVVMCSS